MAGTRARGGKGLGARTERRELGGRGILEEGDPPPYLRGASSGLGLRGA